MKPSDVTVTDLFCGAGGQSQGMQNVGARIVVALNHWPRAIETHNTNFPDTYHEVVNISQANPRRYGYSHILCGSPECTNHAGAKGKKRSLQTEMVGLWDQDADDAATRSRATMWDIPRFAEQWGYEAIIIENVVEAAKWVMWDAWLLAMKSLGYDWKCLYLNSMHFHPVPQSRDRLYVVFWKRGNKAPDLEYAPLARCLKCGQDVNAIQSWKNPNYHWGKYKTQYNYCCPTCASIVEPYYYCAANAIDWGLQGERIGDRKRELAESTRTRILAGLERMSRPDPVGYAAHIFDPATLKAMGDTYQTFLVTVSHGGPQNESRQRMITAPMQSQATNIQSAVVQTPMLIPLSYTGDRRVKFIDQAMPTQTVRQDLGLAIPQPFLISYNGADLGAHSLLGGMGAIATHDRHALVEPELLGNELTVEDCFFRMVTPREVQKAMAFPDEYIITGNQRDKVHQLGNACTPPVLAWIGERVVATL
ncbi:MAG TPA: DNA cytosine methyltransferase [Ktedonobacteraceae bacterium]